MTWHYRHRGRWLACCPAFAAMQLFRTYYHKRPVKLLLATREEAREAERHL